MDAEARGRKSGAGSCAAAALPSRRALTVGGRRYANAAAKFWMTFVDGILEEHPGCALAELTAPAVSALKPEHLHPERELQNSLERLAGADLAQMLRETMAELELMGPPCAVRVRLLAKDGQALAEDRPLEYLDADLFPYMLVWLLEWAGLPAHLWNHEEVDGAFDAEDRRRRLTYSFSFRLRHRHVSEGLYERTLAMSVTLTAVV